MHAPNTKFKAQAKTKPIPGLTMRINTRITPALGITPNEERIIILLLELNKT